MKQIQPDDLFSKLDEWRHLPAYQLERRADIFFAMYLPELIQSKFGVEIEGMIPEFPIHIGTIDPERDINQSFKVDYLAKVKDARQVLLIELKTDDSSRRDRQDDYLKLAQDAGLRKLLVGVNRITQATTSRGKYHHLLSMLQKLGLVTVDSNGGLQVDADDFDIRLVYLQPNNTAKQDNIISFHEAAEIIRQHEDALSQRFAVSLLKWAETKPGEG